MGYSDTHPAHKKLAPVIVSIPLPNGVTYLLNILLEMDIPIYGRNIDLFWKERNGSLFLDPYARRREITSLPAFDSKRTMPDRSPLGVDNIHEWPVESLLSRKVILFVRDGRDGLYSMYKRLKRQESLLTFLNEPHTPFSLTYPLTWSLFHFWWINFSLNHPDFLLIRFEDIKADPYGETRRVLSFIGVERTDEELSYAIAQSDTGKAIEHFQKYSRPQQPIMSRRGKSYEWKESWSAEQLSTLPESFLSVSESLGYETRSQESIHVFGDQTRPTQVLVDRWMKDIYTRSFRNTFAGQKLFQALCHFVQAEPMIQNDLDRIITVKSYDCRDIHEPFHDFTLRILFKYYRYRQYRNNLYWVYLTVRSRMMRLGL